MSYLFSIPLEGLGTPDVEALHSYIYRLAVAHGLTTWQLRNVLDTWWSETHDQSPPFPCPSSICGISISGFGQDVSRVISIVEAATGQRGLIGSTLNGLRDVSGWPCTGAFFHSVRHCPACLQSIIARDGEAYIKLVWLMEATSRCDIHEIELSSRCNHCGNIRALDSVLGHPQHCPKCGKNPYENYREWKRSDRPSQNERDLLEVLGYLSGHPAAVFSVDAPRIFFEARQAWEYDRLVKEKIGSFFHRRMDHQSKPRFRSLLRLAAYYGVPLLAILTDPEGAARMQSLPIPLHTIEPPPSRGKSGPDVREALNSRLLSALSSSTDGFTAAQICHELGVSPNFGDYWCRPLMIALRRHRLAQKRAQASKQRESRKLIDADQMTSALIQYRTQRASVAALAKKFDIPIWIVRHRARELRVGRELPFKRN